MEAVRRECEAFLAEHATPATATNVLLNGLAISFATGMDDAFAQFCLPAHEREEINTALASLALYGDSSPMAKSRAWLFHRSYAAACMVSILALNLAPEPFMTTFGDMPEGIQICSDIINSADGFAQSFIAPIAAVWSLVNYKSIAHRKDAVAAISHAALSSIFVVVMYGVLALIVWFGLGSI